MSLFRTTLWLSLSLLMTAYSSNTFAFEPIDNIHVVASKTTSNFNRDSIKLKAKAIYNSLAATEQLSIFNQSIHSLNKSQQEDIKMLITDQLYNQLEQYQSLGLYNYIHDFHFEISWDKNENYYDDGTNTLYLNIDSDCSFNHLKLTKKNSFGFELIKVVSHELAHVHFTHHHVLFEDDSIDNKNLTKHIYSDFLLTVNGTNNTTFSFIHENFADVYGEFAYLKVHNFDKDSIAFFEHDIDLRRNLDIYTTSKLGINADPHNTVNSLNTLLELVNNIDTKEILKQLSGENCDKLVKAITFNTYKAYLQSNKVKEDILFNINHNKNSTQDTTYYNNLNLPSYINIIDLIHNLQ